MAGVLPAETVIRVLNPIIKTGDFPVNQAAIKMMTKVAEHEANRDVVIANLGDIMPGLLKVRFLARSPAQWPTCLSFLALRSQISRTAK